MNVVERTVLGVLLAATLATLLLVARNGLAPVQHPLSFGLVLWVWVALLYSTVGVATVLMAGLVSLRPGLRAVPRWLVFVATTLFAAVALLSNPRAVSSLFLLQQQGPFRALVPASAVLCGLALLAVGAPLARVPAAAVRTMALLAVAGGLLSLVPDGASHAESRGTSANARIQGLRFALVGVDGADWDLMEPKIAARIVLPDDVTLADARAFMDVSAAEFERMRVKHPSPLTGIANEFTYFHSTFATNERLALDLMERSRARYGQPADLLVLFRLVDKTCHTALVYSELVEEHLGASSDDLRRYGRVVSEAYRAVDRALGRIQEAFGAGNVIIVSDHGFELEGARGYNHTLAPAGVFLAAGPAFLPGRVDGLSVLDVMPLLLYLKGFPVAEDFDGRMPTEVLQPGLLAASPLRRIASYGRRGEGGQHREGSSKVDAEMIERLRALGYLR